MAGSKAKTFSCPACGGTVTLRAAGHTISAVCVHCSTVIDTANENFRIIKQNHERSRITPIPIGARGALGGTKWEVIGYVEKRDIEYGSLWDEYLLFNPYFGFRFLVEADNHWNLARVTKQYVPLAGDAHEITFEGDRFSIFYKGQSSVNYVKGEFYWRIRKDDKESYTDYIAPPRMLSVEKSADEVTFSISDYLLPAEVEQAFGVELPKRIGVAPNQPKPFANALLKMWLVSLLACVAAFIVQASTGSNQVVNSSRFHIEQANAVKSLSTPVFAVPSRSNLVIQGGASPLRNNWVDLDLTLVNDASNEAFEATQSMEYYSGVDDGESWSEGNTSGETYFPAVDKGSYRVVVEPAPGQLGPEGMDVWLTIRHNVPAWGNFWLAVLLLIAFPVYASVYRWRFESKRWSNSDYAPSYFSSSSGNDDDD
jgi:hypothetical protein